MPITVLPADEVACFENHMKVVQLDEEKNTGLAKGNIGHWFISI